MHLYSLKCGLGEVRLANFREKALKPTYCNVLESRVVQRYCRPSIFKNKNYIFGLNMKTI